MIPNKLIAVGVGLLVLWFLYSQFTGLIEDNATQKTEISNLKSAADLLGKELIKRGKLNTQLNKDKATIESENKELQYDLTELKTTPQQAKCDTTPTPAGYADRVLNRKHTNKESLP